MDEQNAPHTHDRIRFSHENEILVHATMWMNLENIMLNKRQTQKCLCLWAHIVCFHSREMSRMGKSIKTESSLAVARGEEKGDGIVIANGYCIFFWVMKMFGTRQRSWLHNIVNAPNATEWCILTWLILSCVNFVSIEKKIKIVGKWLYHQVQPLGGRGERKLPEGRGWGGWAGVCRGTQHRAHIPSRACESSRHGPAG